MRHLFVLSGVMVLASCATVGSVERPQSYYDTAGAATGNEGSILKDSGGVLNDDAIQALLYEKITLPPKIRIAILKLSEESYWRFYSSDFTQLNESITENFINKLRSSERVYDASFLPSMLVPEKRNVAALREAAARFQADMLLLYRSSCSSYQKYRFISPDESKSYCSVEAVMLDIRKGIIGKSIVTTQDFSAKKAQDDTNFEETIKKAELEALSKALGEIAGEVVGYLKTVALLSRANGVTATPSP